MHKISLDGNSLNPEQAMAVSSGNAKASLSDTSRDAMEASRRVIEDIIDSDDVVYGCLLYTSPSPRDKRQSRMPACG